MARVDIILTLTLLLLIIFILTGSNHVGRIIEKSHVTGAVLLNMKMTIQMGFAHQATHLEGAGLMKIHATNSVPDPRIVTATIAKLLANKENHHEASPKLLHLQINVSGRQHAG